MVMDTTLVRLGGTRLELSPASRLRLATAQHGRGTAAL